MRYTVCAIYDKAIAAHMRPMFLRSDGEAIRVFTDEVNRVDEANPMRKHPEHFSLIFLGHWFDDEGKFVPPSEGGPTELVSAARVFV